ncbi:MAG: Xaa-Pro aminopeptidase [Pseudomonadales bacterium]|nr:Xaa-Pro aminopeptidase [Pseudomonadales bacterium]
MKNLPASLFAKRRQALMDDLLPDSIAIIPAANELLRNNDVHFNFRQDSNFYYLTGFNEPEAVAVIIPGREHGEFVLFCREKDPTRELWDGYRAGQEGAMSEFAADDAFPIGDIDEILPGLLEGRSRVYYAMGRHKEFDAQVMSWVNRIRANVRQGAHPPGEFSDLDHLLHDLRLYKSQEELTIMAEAGRISAEAHQRAMRFCQPGVYEYQLEAEILHEFAMQGARDPAYGSIVGGGANACVLHYRENNQPLHDGDLVLIDAGCEYQFYAADITRTFPVNGKFSKPQADIYNIVLRAQLAAIEQTRVGKHWNDAHDATVKVIAEGLQQLGLLSGSLEHIIATESYRKYYMHRAGHWLGMDVHDVGDYKVHDQWRELEVGMVMTVEPGIYIPLDDHSVPAEYRGIGIRIEDDVAVTKQGPWVLTESVPKTIAEIESLMASRNSDAA